MASILDATHLTVLDKVRRQILDTDELLLDALRCIACCSGNDLEGVNREDVDSYIDAKKGNPYESAASKYKQIWYRRVHLSTVYTLQPYPFGGWRPTFQGKFAEFCRSVEGMVLIGLMPKGP